MSAMERRDFLVELGTEELPPKALKELEAAFASEIVSQLEQFGLKIPGFQSFSTPRRLAVRVRRLATRQPDQQIKRRGPPLRAAFDAGGTPTRAAAAFAESCGVMIDALGRETDAKGNEYLSYAGTKAGTATAELLPGIVQKSLDALPIPKRMRWGAGEAQFVRPVHWLVLMFGKETLPTSILDAVSGNLTRGHRFMAPKPIRLASPASYERTLLNRGKVVASFSARRARILEQVEGTAAQLGGRAVLSDALLDEVTALVEWPVPVAGRFEERFLTLPREVLISTLQDHQRYFAVEDAGGALLPWFITLSNVESRDESVVRAGNERVVRPRLADAAFFYELDRKQPLSARQAGLDAVTFQARLGSIGDKVRRVAALAAQVGAAIGADAARVQQAAALAKCDLLTAMVGEFPELQGIMGRYYALADGAPAEVAEAVREHYLPRGAGDSLPGTPAGMAVAIADKLDTLTGIFAIGQKPSGTRDPFGLRRAAIGVLRIVQEQRLELDLPRLLEAAVAAQPVTEGDAASVVADVQNFMMERLRAQYLDATALTGISTEMFDAVLITAPRSIPDFDARLQALRDFLRRPEAQSLTAANKRIANILKKSASGAPMSVDSRRLHLEAEQQLHAAVEALRPAIETALQARDYAAALDQLSHLKPPVDRFFDQVLVNDPDEGLRNNRLALLGALRALFTRIADISQLPG